MVTNNFRNMNLSQGFPKPFPIAPHFIFHTHLFHKILPFIDYIKITKSSILSGSIVRFIYLFIYCNVPWMDGWMDGWMVLALDTFFPLDSLFPSYNLPIPEGSKNGVHPPGWLPKMGKWWWWWWVSSHTKCPPKLIWGCYSWLSTQFWFQQIK